MKVDTHISGSQCVVWRTKEHYIDARRDARRPHLTFIEVVRNGRVYLRDTVGLCDTPKRIVELMRSEFT